MRKVVVAIVGLVLFCNARYVPAQAADSVAARSAKLNALFKEIWEDQLKHSPEYASSLGDRRYNDQVSDLSPRAYNDQLARDREYLMRLVMIDTTGLTDAEKLSDDLMERQLTLDEEGARFKEWEMPVNQFHGIQTDLPGNTDNYPFATVKDYDDYIARLKKYPGQMRQATQNLLSGIDDGRVQPAYLLEKALKQTEELAGQTPEASPFALPLRKFPAAVDAANRKRIATEMLAAIQDEVLPAYVRFANFLKATEIPAAQKGTGVLPAKEIEAYAAFCAERAKTMKAIAELRAK